MEGRMDAHDNRAIALGRAEEGQDRHPVAYGQGGGGGVGGSPAAQEFHEDAAGKGVLVDEEAHPFTLPEGLEGFPHGSGLGDDPVAEAASQGPQMRLQQRIVQLPAHHGEGPARKAQAQGRGLPVAIVAREHNEALAFGSRGIPVLQPFQLHPPADLIRLQVQHGHRGQEHAAEMGKAFPRQAPDLDLGEPQVGTAQVLPHHPAVPGVDPMGHEAQGPPQGLYGSPGHGAQRRLHGPEEAVFEAMAKGRGSARHEKRRASRRRGAAKPC